MNIRKSVSKALNYNEAKVRAGTGELLLASGFACDVADLTFTDKLRRFEALNLAAEKVKANTLHISINFPPEENLAPEILQRLALDYMDRIGFGEQPFLVYRHFDANHPHIHIVTSTVRPNGQGIPLNNIGRDLSEPAREALEQEYDLIRARGRRNHLASGESVNLATKVQEVTSSYKFTSLEELNAILAEFRMTAWIGAPGSAQRSNRGLVYSRIDEAGYRTGTPIKSSDLLTKPTLKWLEKRFELNKVKKTASRDRVAQVLATSLNNTATINLQRLSSRKIGIHAQLNQADSPVSLLIVDHRNKAVFTPEELGMSTDTLLARLDRPQTMALGTSDAISQTNPQAKKSLSYARPSNKSETSQSVNQTAIAAQIAWSLLAAKTGVPGLAGDELPKRKKRKKRSP